MNKNNNESTDPKVFSYLTLRKAVGIIGITMPIIFVAGSIVFGGCKGFQSTLSMYYHTNMRDIFVAMLSVTAFFLFSYRGYEHRDVLAGSIAAICALGIAFFPVVPGKPLPDCIDQVHDNKIVNAIHYISAIGFFLALSYISLFLFTKKSENPTRMKLKRNKIYRICGIVMLGCLFLIGVHYLCDMLGHCGSLEKLNPIFWLETIALWAFGISWLTKGGTIFVDLKD